MCVRRRGLWVLGYSRRSVEEAQANREANNKRLKEIRLGAQMRQRRKTPAVFLASFYVLAYWGMVWKCREKKWEGQPLDMAWCFAGDGFEEIESCIAMPL